MLKNTLGLKYASLLVIALSFVLVSVPRSAFAANTISTKSFLDLDGNGTVERIRWVMDENVTACAYESGDWTVNTPGSIGVSAIVGLSCTGTDHNLDIAVNASAVTTGGPTAPVISYANAGTAGSVMLTSGAMTAKSSQSITDGAAPVVKRVTPDIASRGASLLTPISITFSEPMSTTDIDTTFSTYPADTYTPAWTVSDTVLTLTHGDKFSHMKNITSTLAAALASSGSNTSLVTPYTWTFTTIGSPVVGSVITATDASITDPALTTTPSTDASVVTPAPVVSAPAPTPVVAPAITITPVTPTADDLAKLAQAQAASSAPVVPVTVFTKSIAMNTTSDTVTVLQNFLDKQGFLVMPAMATKGYYGKVTAAAVGAFQEKYGITSKGMGGYGLLGPKTRAKLNELIVK